jgi:MFS family permease
MGLYESAVLLGSLIGALGAGLLYDGSSWEAACLVLAALILSGGVIVPRAVRAVGVPDVPVEVAPPEPARVAPPGPPGPAAASLAVPDGDTLVEPAADRAQETARSPRELLRELAAHAAAYVAAQVVLAVIGLSWLLDEATGRDPDHEGFANLLHSGGRIWTIVLAVDIVWTLVKMQRSRRRTPSDS